MAAGSWNDGGMTPAYPSAWCRYVQGWSKTTQVTGTKRIKLTCVEESDEVCVVGIDGKPKEYFILECVKRKGFDKFVPGEGLLIHHIDEDAENNCNENHLKVGVVQADGQKDLQRIGLFGNQGDDGDIFPGSANRTSIDSKGFPNTLTYGGKSTGISIKGIRYKEGKAVAFVKIQEITQTGNPITSLA